MCDCPHTAAAARLIFQQSRIYAGVGIALSRLTTGRICSTLNSTSGSDLLKKKMDKLFEIRIGWGSHACSVFPYVLNGYIGRVVQMPS